MLEELGVNRAALILTPGDSIQVLFQRAGESQLQEAESAFQLGDGALTQRARYQFAFSLDDQAFAGDVLNDCGEGAGSANPTSLHFLDQAGFGEAPRRLSFLVQHLALNDIQNLLRLQRRHWISGQVGRFLIRVVFPQKLHTAEIGYRATRRGEAQRPLIRPLGQQLCGTHVVDGIGELAGQRPDPNELVQRLFIGRLSRDLVIPSGWRNRRSRPCAAITKHRLLELQ